MSSTPHGAADFPCKVGLLWRQKALCISVHYWGRSQDGVFQLKLMYVRAFKSPKSPRRSSVVAAAAVERIAADRGLCLGVGPGRAVETPEAYIIRSWVAHPICLSLL